MKTSNGNRSQFRAAMSRARRLACVIARNRSSGFSSDVIDRTGRIEQGSPRR